MVEVVSRHGKDSSLAPRLESRIRRLRMLFGSYRLHLLLGILGVLLYFSVGYSPLNPLGSPTTIPVPIVNGLWGGAVVLGIVVVGSTEILMLRTNIEPASVEPTHEDGSGGYSAIVKGFSRVLEVFVFGIWLFLLSFYYFISYIAAVMIVSAGLVILLGLFFVFVYRIHLVIVQVKTTRMNLLREEVAKLEKMLETAIEQNDLPLATKTWIKLTHRKECLASTRLKELRTWPISVPVIGRLSGFSLASLLLELTIPLLELLLRAHSS
jgi:hypothetical protein